MAIQVYRLALANLGTAGLGTEIISDVLLTTGVAADDSGSLVWTEQLNDPGTLEFSLPIDHAAVTRANFAVGQREIHLYRNGTLVWGGKLWLADLSGWFVRFVAYGWYYDLREKREVTTDKAWTAVDQSDIVRELIDDTQALTGGPLGLTHFDTADSGTVRTLVVCAEERRRLGDIIEDFAAADDGFDFAVTADKKFRMWYPKRGGTPGITFNGATTVSELGYQDDATSVVTEYAVVGPKQTCAVPLVVTAADVTARGLYGLQHGSISMDTPETAHLQGVADELILEYKEPRFQPHAMAETLLGAPAITAYEIGDNVTLTADRGAAGGFGQFSRSFRLLGRRFTMPAHGQDEHVELILDSVPR